MSNKLPHWI